MRNSLTTTVTNILFKRVTDEQAKQFALDNYGMLATYIRQEFIKEISAKNIKTDENINSRKKAFQSLPYRNNTKNKGR